MIERVIATEVAASLIRGLRQRHGEVMFYLSHGCCDGSTPMCLKRGEMSLSEGDVQLGEVLGTPLTLNHQAAVPHTTAMTLLQRRDHGADLGVPMAVLRFALPPLSWWQRLTRQGWARFEAGDLLGIVPIAFGIWLATRRAA